MKTRSITVGHEHATPINLYCEDHGCGKAAVLVQGYPSKDFSWSQQITALLAAGYRVITYHRRGFGKSSRPTSGYDYDTFAADLHTLLTKLDLNDCILVGFAMGTAEIARYLGTYGSNRVSKAVFIAPVPPFLLKTADTPSGSEERALEAANCSRPLERATFLRRFGNFYQFVFGNDVTLGSDLLATRYSKRANSASHHERAPIWLTDFRRDLPRVDVPTLIIQGDADRVLPTSGCALAKAIKGARFVAIAGGPHSLMWTHADQVNAELLRFLRPGYTSEFENLQKTGVGRFSPDSPKQIRLTGKSVALCDDATALCL